MGTVTLQDANVYFDTYVLHNQPWTKADDATKQRALNNAEYLLYQSYPDVYNADDPDLQLPAEAVYQQALWLLRQNEAIMSQDFNVIGQSVSGISMQMKGTKYSLISPDAQRIIEEDLRNRDNTDYNGRFGWLVL